MKRFTTLFIALICMSLVHAQNNDCLQIDSSTLLNEQQVELLNTLLKDSRNTFNFQDKKVAFITGTAGTTLLSRDDYFKLIQPRLNEGGKPQIWMVRLTQQEKDLSGGYDVFVLSWVKVLPDKWRRRHIEQLGEQTSG